MAGLIVWSFEGRLFSSLTHLLKKDFVSFRPFFHLHHFKKGHWGRPGVMGGDRGRLGETKGTAGALLSNLQLVPGRDNIGDVLREESSAN